MNEVLMSIRLWSIFTVGTTLVALHFNSPRSRLWLRITCVNQLQFQSCLERISLCAFWKILQTCNLVPTIFNAPGISYDNRSEMASSYTCDLKLRHQSCIKLHKNCKYKQTLKWTRNNFLCSIQLPIQSAPPVGFMTSRWRVLIWRKSWTAFCFLQ